MTAVRSSTTLRNTLRVTGMGAVAGPCWPRTRVMIGT